MGGPVRHMSHEPFSMARQRRALTCLITSAVKLVDDVVGICSTLKQSRLSVWLDGHGCQFLQVDLHPLKPMKRRGKAMTTVDGQKFEAVLIAILDLNFVLGKGLGVNSSMGPWHGVLTTLRISDSSPTCTTTSMSGGAIVFHLCVVSAHLGFTGPNIVVFLDSCAPNSRWIWATGRSQRVQGCFWKYSGTGELATRAGSNTRPQSTRQRDALMAAIVFVQPSRRSVLDDGSSLKVS